MITQAPSLPASATRRRDPSDPWLVPRAALITRLLGVRVSLADPRVARLEQATREADPLADAFVETLQGPDAGLQRRQFDQALEHGLASVAQPSPALKALFEQIESVPVWLDRERVRLGTRTMLRHGFDGLTSLSAASLMSGYLSAMATKPLAFTGALQRMAMTRLSATSKHVYDVARAERMERFSNGFKTTVRVRLMHAMVRRNLLASPRWQVERWGVPINQRDMLSTHLQFTVAYLGGVLALGRLDTIGEREAVMHVWRYVSHLLGVNDELCPRTLREGLELASLINATEPGPDEDSRALAKALLETWQGGPQNKSDAPAQLVSRFLLGFSRDVMGDRAADALGLPDTFWKYVPPAVALLRLPMEVLQLLVPAVREKAVESGRARIEAHLRAILAGRQPEHVPYVVQAA